ncbi:peptidyl-prolyl isomerase pasticcino1 [Stylonychia lemnae]|uniref:Peptidyl-prolyl isomerase pasticcino1 n=1 Tax=Stylonychia lemnae TaxID=5949 RepID=A0A077ZTF7_STYLE|nr:peptidyl-prolyl isomerase pasticcino1 [Stylonychia lemnae]|eukprot:CDW73193.1 peptidyl-prolyl isomerase pasticcino1 [Stylonychia lemnae]
MIDTTTNISDEVQQTSEQLENLNIEEEKTQSSGASREDLISKAILYKEEGNSFFKQKDYKRALAKYSRVQCFTNVLIPNKEGDMAMYANLSKKAKDLEVEGDDKEKIIELMATTFLNMSICFFLTGQFSKSVEKATLSIKSKKTIKALYRRGKAQMARKDYDQAIKDFEEAVRMDPSDPNDIQQEIMQAKRLERESDKQRQQKMQGFLLKGNE